MYVQPLPHSLQIQSKVHHNPIHSHTVHATGTSVWTRVWFTAQCNLCPDQVRPANCMLIRIQEMNKAAAPRSRKQRMQMTTQNKENNKYINKKINTQ